MRGELTPEDLAFIDAFVEADTKRQRGEFIVGVVDAEDAVRHRQDRQFFELYEQSLKAKQAGQDAAG